MKVFSGDETLLDTRLLGPGHTGRVARAYEIPLDDAVGLMMSEFDLSFGHTIPSVMGFGSIISESTEADLATRVLPFSDDFDDLAHWGQFNGV